MTANPLQPAPQLSIVIPVYNEEEGLQALFDRLYPAMDQLQAKLNLRYEIVFVNDGSKDRSAGLLAKQVELRPDVTRAVLFHSNFGQHMAIMAGFEYSRGEHIITLDAVTGEISVNVSEEEFARRKTKWVPRDHEYGSGAIWKYAQLVGPARYGALTNPGAKGEKEQYADI